MPSIQSLSILINLLIFVVQSRIGIVLRNHFESFPLICPEGSTFPCAATNGEFTLMHQYDFANHRFYEGYIGCEDGKVVITTSGLSTINSALTTQLLIETYRNTDDPIDMILTYGIAGGIDERLSIGDVVVASKWAIYSQWLWQDEDDDVDDLLPLEDSGDLGYFDRDFGYFETSEFGRVWFQPQELFLEPEVRTRAMFFDASEDAVDIMKDIEIDVESKLLQCVPDSEPLQCLADAPQVFTSIDGEDVIGLTSSIFVDNTQWRRKLFAMYGAQSSDMESGSIAIVAATNEIPFLAFRSLSDLAGAGDNKQNTNEIEIFLSLAAKNSITVLVSWIQAAYCQNTKISTSEFIDSGEVFPVLFRPISNNVHSDGHISFSENLNLNSWLQRNIGLIVIGVIIVILASIVGHITIFCCYFKKHTKTAIFASLSEEDKIDASP